MTRYRRGDDRDELLADVAEMYHEQGMTQAEIARAIGVTRSAVSRMLTETRQKGIVEIHIRRPLSFDEDLGSALIRRFGLRDARVLAWSKEDQYDELRSRLGKVAAQVLVGLIQPNTIIGVAWGTTVSATIDALEVPDHIPARVVQLVGVLGSSSHAFNAQALVESLARKLGGQGIYLYTPFIVDNEDMVRSLMSNRSVKEAIAVGRSCDVALLGIGTTNPQFCSLYQGGHITRDNLDALRRAGAVGDVSGHHFDIRGRTPETDLHNRLVGIARQDLLNIPTRLGVAGGAAKAPAILGALRGGYVNLLVTDSQAAAQILQIDID
jgi:DNA-binding transcriptional regulator LsrR (DeoR family)